MLESKLKRLQIYVNLVHLLHYQVKIEREIKVGREWVGNELGKFLIIELTFNKYAQV